MLDTANDEEKLDGDNCGLTEEEKADEDEGNGDVEEKNLDDANGEAFSTENFKIIIHNIPKYKSQKQLKNFIKQRGVVARKMIIKRDHAFVTFNNDDDREKAILNLNNFEWKGYILRVKRADPTPDPVNQKRQKCETTDDDVKDPTEALFKSTVPLVHEPYERQLLIKQASSLKLLINASRQIAAVSHYPFDKEKGYYGTLERIRASPVVNGYRNKCEFTVGFDVDCQAEVGFRISRYRDGGFAVVGVDACPHVPKMMKNFIAHFRTFLRNSDKPAYDVIKKSGFWKMLTIKFFKMDFMIIITVSPTGISDAELENVKTNLVDTFLPRNEEYGYRTTSIYLSKQAQQSDVVSYEHIGGAPYVYENLLNCRFRISPATFFQTNTAACEMLYTTLAEMLTLNNQTLLLDVCCGAGTIGISLACRVKRVMGFELCAEAVEDARINAKCNEKDNCEFLCGKAEDLFEQIRRTKSIPFNEYENVTAVLDPPRKGLGNKIISCIRDCKEISKLVYVSCDPKAASKNFVDLCRRTSNRYSGFPFELKKVVPVDLFPHTNHCEWLLLFEREKK